MREDDRDEQLHRADADVAARGVEAERNPFSRSGKKNEMFAMLDAKLPPPRPAVAAASAISQNGVAGFVTSNASNVVGMNSSSALTIVQLRPPNFGTAKVYGKRISEPIRPGSATSENSCSVV